MWKSTTSKNIGFVIIGLYTLVQIYNIFLMIQGAYFGCKDGHIANIPNDDGKRGGKEQKDLLQFHLKRKKKVKKEPSKFMKKVYEFDDLRKG